MKENINPMSRGHATWFLRKIFWKIQTLHRGRFYGIARPTWWPTNFAWELGPQNHHAGKEVTIFLSGKRYIFKPARLGPYKGHQFEGCLRADSEVIASHLSSLNLPINLAPIFAAVSSFEGGFDAIQTYDGALFSWGFIQFAANGGLVRLLANIQQREPELFQQYFRIAGIHIEHAEIQITRDGQSLRGMKAINRLHDDPKLWKYFLISANDTNIQALQILTAYENYYQPVLEQTLEVGSKVYSFDEFFGDNQYGRAVLFDRAVHGGRAYVVRLFQQAARISNIKSHHEADTILSVAKNLERNNQLRWEHLHRALRG